MTGASAKMVRFGRERAGSQVGDGGLASPFLYARGRGGDPERVRDVLVRADGQTEADYAIHKRPLLAFRDGVKAARPFQLSVIPARSSPIQTDP